MPFYPHDDINSVKFGIHMKKGWKNIKWIYWMKFSSVIIIIIYKKCMLHFKFVHFFLKQIIKKIPHRISVKIKQENMSILQKLDKW